MTNLTFLLSQQAGPSVEPGLNASPSKQKSFGSGLAVEEWLSMSVMEIGIGDGDWGRLMKKWLGGASLVVLLLVVLGARGWSQSQQPLSFGVIIWRSPTLTAQFWNPIL